MRSLKICSSQNHKKLDVFLLTHAARTKRVLRGSQTLPYPTLRFVLGFSSLFLASCFLFTFSIGLHFRSHHFSMLHFGSHHLSLLPSESQHLSLLSLGSHQFSLFPLRSQHFSERHLGSQHFWEAWYSFFLS